MKRRHFIEILGFGVGITILPGFGYETIKPDSLFEDGDTVCFIGDSITHGGKYQMMIANYFLTRFPERNIRFVNCGISGDTSAGVIRRWETDIAPNNLTVAVVMLGMNDVRREFYNTNSPSRELLLCREQAFTDYRKNMEEIVSRLKLDGCRMIVLLTPSPYDQTAKSEVENNLGVNDALENFGKILKKIKAEENIRLIDFHGPMTEVLISQQKENPSFSFASNDRIHPDESGHQLMAYLFLMKLGVPELVSYVSVDYKKKQHEKILNAGLSELKCEPELISFFLKENSLPYPVSEKGKEILKLVPLENKLNNQILKLFSLPDGNWVLKIDGKSIGNYSSSEFQQGINLAFNKETPQYLQAQNILKLNNELRKKEVQYRDLVSINIMLTARKISLDDDKKIRLFFDRFPYGEGSYATRYYEELFSSFFQTRNNLEYLKQEMRELNRQLHTENIPHPHHYELIKNR